MLWWELLKMERSFPLCLRVWMNKQKSWRMHARPVVGSVQTYRRSQVDVLKRSENKQDDNEEGAHWNRHSMPYVFTEYSGVVTNLYFGEALKGIVHPKMIFQLFTTHYFVDLGSGDIFLIHITALEFHAVSHILCIHVEFSTKTEEKQNMSLLVWCQQVSRRSNLLGMAMLTLCL